MCTFNISASFLACCARRLYLVYSMVNQQFTNWSFHSLESISALGSFTTPAMHKTYYLLSELGSRIVCNNHHHKSTA